MKKNIIIIGGGITGLSTAYFFNNKKINYTLFEKQISLGGLCKTEFKDGYSFDYTGHLLHLKSDIAKKFINNILKNNLGENTRNSWIYSNNVFTRYPFQANTYGLPKKIIEECILGYIYSYQKNLKIQNNNSNMFCDWVNNNFGKGIAKYFMFPYNKKLWAYDIKKLTTSWLKGYIPKPNLEEVIIGAFTDNKQNYGYNSNFYYPKSGGINSLITNISKDLKNINLNSKISKINLKKKQVVINNKIQNYDILISTAPLKELILNIIEDIPTNIKKLALYLKHNTVLNVNIGINKKISNKHWIYFPENKYIFYRIGFNDNFSNTMAKKNSSSIYTEISFNKDVPINDYDYYLKKVIQDLISSKIIDKKDKIDTSLVLKLDYAYVLYDKYRDNAVKEIITFLKDNNIFTIGRYGKWEYSAMEDSILDANDVVQNIISNIKL